MKFLEHNEFKSLNVTASIKALVVYTSKAQRETGKKETRHKNHKQKWENRNEKDVGRNQALKSE